MKSEKMNRTGTRHRQKERIREFWRWFVSVHAQLAVLLDEGETKEIARIVVPKLNAMSKSIGWEIGPGVQKPYSFSIALNGSLTNLPVAEKIVKEAPVLPNWEVHAGRPAKIWDGRFCLRNKLGQVVWLNSAGWRYVLTAYDNNRFFDIAVIAEWPSMDLMAKKEAITVAVQGILGEMTMLKMIDRVEVIESPTPEELERSSSISDLKKHLNYLHCPDEVFRHL